MKSLNISTKVYGLTVIILAVLAFISVFLPQGDFVTAVVYESIPASMLVIALVNFATMLFIYGGLGYIGLLLSRKIGFADVWDDDVTNKQRFVTPALIGLAVGVLMVIGDVIFASFNTIGALPHPPFPLSLFASATAGIGEELIFRLFFISLWVWLISKIIFKDRFQNATFWAVSTLSAVAFAVGHIPALLLLYGFENFSVLPTSLIVEILLLNGVIAIPAAYYLRKYGFLAAVGIHFWADIVWHVVYGLY